MNTRRVAPLLLAAAGLALAGCVTDEDPADDHADAVELADELADTQGALEEAERQVDALSDELSAAEDELATAERELADAEEALAAAEARHPDDGADPESDPRDTLSEALDEVGATGSDASGMLDAQLHALHHADGVTAEATGWEPADHPAAGEHIDVHVLTPEEAARELADEVFPGHTGQGRWATTVRAAQDGNTATATVLAWGLKDDSVAGHDLRIHLDAAEQGWDVTEIEERYWCHRGVTDDDLCL